MNALRPLRLLRKAESLQLDKQPSPCPPTSDEFLPRSLLQDPKFSARIKREAHLMRNEAIRDALAALVYWIFGKARRRR